MRLILILLFSLGGSLALAVDPTLVRQSFGKCYYDGRFCYQQQYMPIAPER